MRNNNLNSKSGKMFKVTKVALFVLIILGFYCVIPGKVSYCMDPDNDISNFVDEYQATQEKLLDIIEGGAPDEMKNPQYLIKIHKPKEILSKLRLYDLLDSISESGGNRVEGNLMMTKYTGFKEVNEEVISFGYDYVYDTTRPHMYEKGDKISESGTLDTESKQLSYRFYKERGEEILEETILEIEKLEEGDGVLQYLFWKGGVLKDCIFMRYNQNKSEFIIAAGGESEALEYESILGKDIKPEEMAEGYTKLLLVKIEGDSMQYQEEFDE